MVLAPPGSAVSLPFSTLPSTNHLPNVKLPPAGLQPTSGWTPVGPRDTTEQPG